MFTRGTLGGGRQGNRQCNRLRLGVSGQLELTRGTLACTVEDISRTGARVSLERPPEKGSAAILHVAERSMFAAVVWCRSNLCALRFTDPVTLEEMQRLLWITENRDQYERERESIAAREWSTGRAGREPRARTD